MPVDLEKIYDKLYTNCEARGFAGIDPFDGLNSRLFQLSPLKHFRIARLAWLQLVKRSSVDLRPLLRVPNGVNPKGAALFALAELSRYRANGLPHHENHIHELLETLSALAIKDSAAGTIAFGYNFDWQSRMFFVPRGTPAIVPTAFASQAFFEAYEEFGNAEYLEKCIEICRFVMAGLNRSFESRDEICFSYTPIDRTVIFNASLLAAECLARVGATQGSEEYLNAAERAARFVIRRQRSDGAWVYGEANSQGWADNFHTAYILVSLDRIAAAVPEIRNEAAKAISLGMKYWLDNFFLDDGTPKYYDNATFPIDIHSAAAAIASLAELRHLDDRALPLAHKIADWTAENMLDANGFFYYQKRKSGVVKTPFMRWSQAWMAYAISRLIEATGEST